MSETQFDVIVVGGGYFGSSAAYHLAKAGCRTLLLDAKTVGSGASGANFGNVQVQDANMGSSLALTLEGFRKMEGMEAELGRKIGFGPIPSLIGAEKEEHLPELEKLFKEKKEAGLAIEWLEGERLEKTEPNLAPGSVIAATYYVQGIVYPFYYLYALVEAGQENGLCLRENAPVQSLFMEGGQCRGVVLQNGETLRAQHVVAAAGSGMAELCRTAGLTVPVHGVKAESFATEPIKPFLNTYYSSAAFFAEAHSQTAAATSLCIGQSHFGNLLIAETTKPPAWVKPELRDCTSMEHCQNIKDKIEAFFPALKNIQMLRAWVTDSPYTDDNEPYLGTCGVEGLVLMAGFKSAVVMSGVAGEIVTELVTKNRCKYDLSPYAVGREIKA